MTAHLLGDCHVGLVNEENGARLLDNHDVHQGRYDV